METSEAPGWAKVEVMGHQQVTGRVTEVKICGQSMLKVDPGDGRRPQYLNAASIFRITPVTEEEARVLAPRSTETVTRWELQPDREVPALASADEHDVEDVDYEDEPVSRWCDQPLELHFPASDHGAQGGSRWLHLERDDDMNVILRVTDVDGGGLALVMDEQKEARVNAWLSQEPDPTAEVPF